MSSTSTLLGIIYGNSGSGTTTNPLPALQLAIKNETKDVATTAEEPTVARDIAKFTTAIQNATSISSLLKNQDFLKVFLTANNLADQISYPALVQKALLSDPSQTNSLANTLSNTNYKTTAAAYDFYSNGLSAVNSTQAIAALTNAYAEVTWRTSLDTTTPGLSDALAFISKASSYTSADLILGDPVARTVVTTAYNIPVQIAYQPLQAQEKVITNNLDIAKLQDKTFVNQLAQRYLIEKSLNTSSTSSTPDITSLAVQAQGLLA